MAQHRAITGLDGAHPEVVSELLDVPAVSGRAAEVTADSETTFAERAQLLGESSVELLQLAERQRVMGRFYDLMERSLLKQETITHDDGSEEIIPVYPEAEVTWGYVRFDGQRTHATRGRQIVQHLADNEYMFWYPQPNDHNRGGKTDLPHWPAALPGEMSGFGSFAFAHHRIEKPITRNLDNLRHVEEVTLSSGNSHIVFDFETNAGPFAYVLTDEPLADVDVREISELLQMNHPDWEEPERFVSEA